MFSIPTLTKSDIKNYRRAYMKKHILLTTVLAMSLSLSAAFVSLAGQWQQNSTGWWYQEDNNNYPVNQWKELNGKWYYFNQDGYMVSNTWIGNYYLGSEGAMLTNTTTPDGYNVGPDGAWIQNTSLPVTEYANLIRNNQEDYISQVIFSLNDLIDHGDYYEIPNQIISKVIVNEYDVDLDTIYEGSVFVYKDAIDNTTVLEGENSLYINFKDTLYSSDDNVYKIDGKYYWTIQDFDTKGYATAFVPRQAG